MVQKIGVYSASIKLFLLHAFLTDWPRKAISIGLAVAIWLLVNHSITTTKTLSNIAVRVVNIPSGKTVEGIQSSGLLDHRVTLSVIGNTEFLHTLSSSDLEVLIDAAGQGDEWSAQITKKNLVALNPGLNIHREIHSITPIHLKIKLTKTITEKIPLTITQPIGEAPRGYQFLDIWPSRLTLTVSGPEEVIKHLKTHSPTLTFNLGDISKGDLDTLQPGAHSSLGEEVSFLVPEKWKQVYLPFISDAPLQIDDDEAATLRIDFVRTSLLPINAMIPVTVFYPQEYSSQINPSTCKIVPRGMIQQSYGIDMIAEPLFAKGVSSLFLQIVRNMLEITIIATPSIGASPLEWSIQFLNPPMLEDRYVAAILSDTIDEEETPLQPHLREEYLRHRFRSYMTKFQLFRSDDTQLQLDIHITGEGIVVQDGRSNDS